MQGVDLCIQDIIVYNSSLAFGKGMADCICFLLYKGILDVVIGLTVNISVFRFPDSIIAADIPAFPTTVPPLVNLLSFLGIIMTSVVKFAC